MKTKLTVAATICMLFLIILIQNTQVVVLRLLFWELSMSQILLTGLTLLVGMCFGFILGSIHRLRTSRRNKIDIT